MKISMPSPFHPMLKMKAIRQVPERLCKRCTGTGNGEEIADLGEAPWYGGEFPIRTCNSCSGSGMTIAKTEITALGMALLLVILAVIWACPPQVRLILVLLTASIAFFEGAFWRHQTREENAESSKRKQTVGQIAPRPDLAGPATEGVLSLAAAIEKRRQTPDHIESQLTEGGFRK